MKAWVGIDCGKGGAVGIIYEDGVVNAWHTPVTVDRKKKRKKAGETKTKYSSKTHYDLPHMCSLLSMCRWRKDVDELFVTVTIERQQQHPRDAKQVVFQIGRGQGLWEMACVASNLQYSLVMPSKWKPLYVPKGADKKASMDMCLALYPAMQLPKKKDEALAEALLIADYAKRLEQGLNYPRS